MFLTNEFAYICFITLPYLQASDSEQILISSMLGLLNLQVFLLVIIRQGLNTH